MNVDNNEALLQLALFCCNPPYLNYTKCRVISNQYKNLNTKHLKSGFSKILLFLAFFFIKCMFFLYGRIAGKSGQIHRHRNSGKNISNSEIKEGHFYLRLP